MAQPNGFDSRVGDVFAQLDALSSKGGDSATSWFATSSATSTGARTHPIEDIEDPEQPKQDKPSAGQFCNLEDDEGAVRLANEFDAPLTAHELERSQTQPSSDKWRSRSRYRSDTLSSTLAEDEPTTLADSHPAKPSLASQPTESAQQGQPASSDPAVDQPRKPCFTFAQTGKCRFGSRCRYTHAAPSFKTNPQGFTRYKINWDDEGALSAKANSNAAMAAIRQAAEAKKRGVPVEEAHVIGTKISFKAKRSKATTEAKPKTAKPKKKGKATSKPSMLTFDEDEG
eukprot:m.151031 g.151031  ORF g.151031 m.151031 type:complete len:285 (-) comp16329_c0_seq1:2319-3173(-)